MEITSSTRSKVVPKKVSAEAPSYKLSPEQLQFYYDHGYLVVKGLIHFTDLYNYKQHFIQICKGKEKLGYMTMVKEKPLVDKKKNAEDYVNKVQDLMHDPVFMTYTEHPVLLDVVTQLIGDDVMVIHSMFINKPPGTSIHPAHQDLHYFPFRPADKIVGTWTAVDDVHTENGCLWLIPGSHKANVLYSHEAMPGLLKMYHGITDEAAGGPDRRVHLEMSPGDTVFFHPLLVHGSGANTSKQYRKCISAHYANSHCDVRDARGTAQERIAREIEAEAKRRGFDVGFADIFILKSKQVRGSKL